MRLGSVPFVNAVPLVAKFKAEGGAELEFRWPSKLPELLNAGIVDAILCSSFDALSVPGRTAAAGVCIGSRGAADSVRLFSKVPFSEIGSLCLDASSMTSNALAQIILREQCGVEPAVVLADPDLEPMLALADAAVLIGDKGMCADGFGLHVLDLGKAWVALTGLPFVWALWIGRDDLSSETVFELQSALDWFDGHQSAVIAAAQDQSGWPHELTERYLIETMNYRLTRLDLDGLQRFAELIQVHGLASFASVPRLVGSDRLLSTAPRS